jgi:hypothetical protein
MKAGHVALVGLVIIGLLVLTTQIEFFEHEADREPPAITETHPVAHSDAIENTPSPSTSQEMLDPSPPPSPSPSPIPSSVSILTDSLKTKLLITNKFPSSNQLPFSWRPRINPKKNQIYKKSPRMTMI